MPLISILQLRALTRLYFGLSLPADPRKLRSAYAAACRRLHPDMASYSNQTNVEAFRRMNKLYELLQHPALRRYVIK